MVGVATVGFVMLAPASAPGGPDVDRGQAVAFANVVVSLAARIQFEYAHEVPMADLIGGAVRGLHEEAGVAVPDDLARAIRGAGGQTDWVTLLADARVRLGSQPALAGARSLFAAIGGFRHAIDPFCGLVTQRVNQYASIDQDFGVGIELEGASGPNWVRYQLEYATARGWYPPTGWFGPVPKPQEVRPPVAVPWRVRRVIPGSPAQKAGLRPGDTITHLNGTEVTPANAPELFLKYAYPGGFQGAGIPISPGVQRKLTLARSGKAPFSVELETQVYVPESVYGVIRRADGSWDGMLDRENKIGYVRVGPVEERADEAMGEIIDDLVSRGCRGLILDLRWCPGGYITPAARLAGLFLPRDSVVARMEYRNQERAFGGAVLKTYAPPRYPSLPILLLIGSETTGGGELIAAALQDNLRDTGRLATMGQRTVGRAFLQNTTDAGFGNLLYRLSIGVTYRPSGKPRQRTATSQPTDDWGVRPDPGLEVPVTADLSAEIRGWAEVQAVRPAGSSEALPFDDPNRDPYRLTALAYFRKKLGK
jgi:C-terminal processing protease CtpA/Prc